MTAGAFFVIGPRSQQKDLSVKKIDLETAPTRVGTRYPAPFDVPCRDRHRWLLGDAAGLTQFGVNRVRLGPGAWSSQRHWHEAEDEFVMVLEGELVLVTDAGEERLGPGDSAGFRAGDRDGHHLQNRTDREAVYLEVGTRRPGEGEVGYPDIDLAVPAGGGLVWTHKDGKPYPVFERR